MARYWIIVVTTYYLFRLFLIILPKFNTKDPFNQMMIISQIIGMFFVIIGTIVSFFRDLSVIKFLLYIQAGQMAISNYNVYTIENNLNFQGLNMLSTVFSVLFAILNTYLASLVIEDYKIKAVATLVIFALLEYIIIDTNFLIGEMNSHT